MGGGVSTTNSISRLRRTLVIKAYNLRRSDESLDDQFRKYTHKNADNVLFLSISAIKECLAFDSNSLWIDDLFTQCLGPEVVPYLFISLIMNYLFNIYCGSLLLL
jgi:hypothetical protein